MPAKQIAGHACDSELAEVYVTQMRQFRAGGKQPHYVQAMNRGDAQIRDEVNRLISVRTFATIPPERWEAIFGNNGKQQTSEGGTTGDA